MVTTWRKHAITLSIRNLKFDLTNTIETFNLTSRFRLTMSDAVRTVCQREMDEVRLEADESARWLRRVGEKMWSSRTGREFLTEGIKRFLIDQDIRRFIQCFESIIGKFFGVRGLAELIYKSQDSRLGH